MLVLYIGITIFGFAQILGFEHFNNFSIFRSASYHFLKGLPLYIEYPKEHFDLFYYNPTFPLLFLPFALLPIKAGMLAWMSFTMLACYMAFKSLPMPRQKINFFMLLMLADLFNNITHLQTNPIFLVTMLMTWIMMESGKPFWAALFAVLSFLVKGYGGIIGILCLYYKNWYKVLLYAILWMLIIHALLLLFISPEQLIQYYKDWLQIISSDTIKESYSVYGLFKNLNLAISETYIVGFALLVLAAYLLMQFFVLKPDRAQIIAFLLIWVIVFNRASEPATYILAMAGVVLWHLNRPANTISTLLFWTTLVTSSLFPTDISPIFDKLRYQYYLKAILCLVVLADILQYTAMHLKPRKNVTQL